MRKRIADILEKFAVASLVIGVYQANVIAMGVGVACTTGCLTRVWRDAQ
jgi:hypothetical protein